MIAPMFFELGYQYLLRPLLFLRDPELVHNGCIHFGEVLGQNYLMRYLTRQIFNYDHPTLQQRLYGIDFRNPVGLAAGFDKDARLTRILDAVGFGFMEAGSITSKPYAGNPPPRLFRLKKSKGLVVNYGLKNSGADAISKKLKDLHKESFPIGLSIAKSNDASTVTEKAGVADYTECFEKLTCADAGDFYTINISCPNAYGGEPFTTVESLDRLLKSLRTVHTHKPIFVKMPINLSWKDFKPLLEVIVGYHLAGVVIGNLNKAHDPQFILDSIPDNVKGGISGIPNQTLSNDLISKTYQEFGKKLTIVGVGGIFSAQDAYEKIKRGASLVQLITGMIYQGPQVIGQINQGLVGLLKNDGYKHLSEAVGAYHRFD